MANPHKGDVPFDAEGRSYTLRFSANAICELEDALDRGIIEIGEEMKSWAKAPKKIRFGFIRAVMWAGMREHHPDITLQQAGEIMVAAGGLSRAMELINDAFMSAFPAETKGARPMNRAARRRQAATGTGKA